MRCRQLAERLLVFASLPGIQITAQQPVTPPVIADVRVVASDTLEDVALTVIERGRSTIYYNPGLLDHVGPRLARFFLAHEYGHIVGGHGGGAFSAGDPDFSLARRAQELDGDCYAAQRLASSDLADVAAAIRFFTLIGGFRFDDLHPSGTERAARIAACAATGAVGVPAEAPSTLTPVGTVEATGSVAVTAGGSLLVTWSPGARPALVPSPAF